MIGKMKVLMISVIINLAVEFQSTPLLPKNLRIFHSQIMRFQLYSLIQGYQYNANHDTSYYSDTTNHFYFPISSWLLMSPNPIFIPQNREHLPQPVLEGEEAAGEL